MYLLNPMRSTYAPNLTGVSLNMLASLLEQVDELKAMVAELHAREATKPEIDPKARYHLADAASFLDTSTSTLKRRARRNKLVILYDGKTPFVMGAELLRYAREGARRKAPKRRRSTTPGG